MDNEVEKNQIVSGLILRREGREDSENFTVQKQLLNTNCVISDVLALLTPTCSFSTPKLLENYFLLGQDS